MMLGAALVMTGCADDTTSSRGFRVAGYPYPLALEEAVPDGVPAEDVLQRDGCYYYRKGGNVIPVSAEAIGQAGGGVPRCQSIDG